MRELDYPFDAEWILRKKKSIKKQLLEEKTRFIEKRIAILGGSTTDEIKNMMELFLLNYGIRPVFFESEYNQYYEDGMFDNPELVKFSPEIIYIHTSNRNILEWPKVSDDSDTVEKKIQQISDRFMMLWMHLEEMYQCPIIQNNFELPFYRLLGNQDASMIQGKVNYVTRLNLIFGEYARKHKGFYIHDINYESASYGLEKWSDPYYWYMYKYALCVPAIPYLAHGVCAIIKSIFGKNKKIFALDLDNTLWGGVIGDDGAGNIEIGQETSVGQAYSEFQNYLKEQKEIGVLLSVVSKNDEENAMLGLERSDSVLRKDDFISIKANWEPKDRNIVDIAAEISLLPDSFVFVDDNPAERELVKSSIDGIAVPEIGIPEQYIKILDRAAYFEVTNLSEDDKKRTDMYISNMKRKQAETKFVDYTEYLYSLEMHGIIKPFEANYFSRITQLTNKSNQFNLTTRRYTQSEIEEVANQPNKYITLYGRLEDKFGDNGVVSIIIGEIKDDELHIDLWLMSCRVLKRQMECAMMDMLVQACEKKNISSIYGYYYPTSKNKMVEDFYSLQGFTRICEDEKGNTTWKLCVNKLYETKNKVIKIN